MLRVLFELDVRHFELKSSFIWLKSYLLLRHRESLVISNRKFCYLMTSQTIDYDLYKLMAVLNLGLY